VTALHRRLKRLERSMPRPDPWAGMDMVLAGLTVSELRTLLGHVKRTEGGQPTTPEQDHLWAIVEDCLRAVGIAVR
jgi:hypothetical protein